MSEINYSAAVARQAVNVFEEYIPAGHPLWSEPIEEVHWTDKGEPRLIVFPACKLERVRLSQGDYAWERKETGSVENYVYCKLEV